jgi:hypothetical protein
MGLVRNSLRSFAAPLVLASSVLAPYNELKAQTQPPPAYNPYIWNQRIGSARANAARFAATRPRQMLPLPQSPSRNPNPPIGTSLGIVAKDTVPNPEQYDTEPYVMMAPGQRDTLNNYKQKLNGSEILKAKIKDPSKRERVASAIASAFLEFDKKNGNNYSINDFYLFKDIFNRQLEAKNFQALVDDSKAFAYYKLALELLANVQIADFKALEALRAKLRND